MYILQLIFLSKHMENTEYNPENLFQKFWALSIFKRSFPLKIYKPLLADKNTHK